MGSVTSLSKQREKRENERHRRNRLLMLMHSFLDAADKGDTDSQRLIGRGLSGYTREELNAAEAEARKTRAQPEDSA